MITAFGGGCPSRTDQALAATSHSRRRAPQVVKCACWLGHRQVIHSPSRRADLDRPQASKPSDGHPSQAAFSAPPLSLFSSPQKSRAPSRGGAPFAWAQPVPSQYTPRQAAGPSMTRSKADQPNPLFHGACVPAAYLTGTRLAAARQYVQLCTPLHDMGKCLCLALLLPDAREA